MTSVSGTRRQVSARAVSIAIAGVSAKHRVDRDLVVDTQCLDPRAVAARHEAWKLLVQPGVSIASIARAWPCHHTTILFALGRTGRKHLTRPRT